jgi:hypothetical protein
MRADWELVLLTKDAVRSFFFRMVRILLENSKKFCGRTWPKHRNFEPKNSNTDWR